jgi:hypothetical protein
MHILRLVFDTDDGVPQRAPSCSPNESKRSLHTRSPARSRLQWHRQTNLTWCSALSSDETIGAKADKLKTGDSPANDCQMVAIATTPDEASAD